MNRLSSHELERRACPSLLLAIHKTSLLRQGKKMRSVRFCPTLVRTLGLILRTVPNGELFTLGGVPMRSIRHRLSSLLLLFIVTGPKLLQCQVAGGTISGTVTDPNGARIPEAQISIQSRATGVTRTVAANKEGFY